MEAILDTSMEVVVRRVSLPSEVEAALLGKPNVLRMLYELVLAFECGEWCTCDDLVNRIGIPGDTLNQAYAGAVMWVQGLQMS